VIRVGTARELRFSGPMRSHQSLRAPLPALALALTSLAACSGSSNEPTPPVCSGPGTICPFAGNGDPAFTGEGEPVLETSLYWPIDLEFAPDGRAYILD